MSSPASSAITVWIFTSDAGSDEVFARNAIQAHAQTCPTTWVLEMNCMAHQLRSQWSVISVSGFAICVRTRCLHGTSVVTMPGTLCQTRTALGTRALISLRFHLITAGCLKTVDEWMAANLGMDMKYFGTLSKIMHCWRERAKDICKAWRAEFGPVAAEVSTRVPPKCLAGRWGSVSRCEQHVLSRPPHELQKIWPLVFAKQAGKKKRKAGTLDPIQAEEQESYGERMGRWSREAMTGIVDKTFWRLMFLMSRARRPLDHFANFIMKKREPDEPQNVALLAGGKEMRSWMNSCRSAVTSLTSQRCPSRIP